MKLIKRIKKDIEFKKRMSSKPTSELVAEKNALETRIFDLEKLYYVSKDKIWIDQTIGFKKAHKLISLELEKRKSSP